MSDVWPSEISIVYHKRNHCGAKGHALLNF